MAVATDIVKRTKAAISDIRGVWDRIYAIDGQRDAGPEAYRALFDEIEDSWQEFEADSIDLRFQMREHITREEWKKLYEKLNN